MKYFFALRIGQLVDSQNIISYHPSKEGDITFISMSDASGAILPKGKA